MLLLLSLLHQCYAEMHVAEVSSSYCWGCAATDEVEERRLSTKKEAMAEFIELVTAALSAL